MITQENIATLGMGSFSNDDVAEIESVMGSINLQADMLISSFGNHAGKGAESIDALSDLMENAPSSALAGKITEISQKLRDADPRNVIKKPGIFARFTGAAIESNIRYLSARKSLDALINEAQSYAKDVRLMLDKLESMTKQHGEEIRTLRIDIAAGKLFLELNPAAGKPAQDGTTFDNPRERFSRRLANLAALLASHEMSITQMRLARAVAVDLLDRFQETDGTLIPVWRSHTLALMNNTNNNPEIIAAASKAHEALLASLTASSKG